MERNGSSSANGLRRANRTGNSVGAPGILPVIHKMRMMVRSKGWYSENVSSRPFADGGCFLSFLLFLVPVGLSEVLGWVESRKESVPKTVATQEQVHVYEHYVPEAEEALAGARIGDPQAEKENIIRLYKKIYYDDSFELRETSDEHHWVRDRSSHIPEEFTIPDNCEWIDAMYASSKDEKAEDVIICMALKEYGLEKYGFDVYEYDEEQGAYLAEKVTYLSNSSDWNGSPERRIAFPYVYHDVLYMHVNEYEIGYEGEKYLTILVQTKEYSKRSQRI